MQERKVYTLVVKGLTSHLSEIRTFISARAGEERVPAAVIESLIVAVDEAATNIIKHAYHSRSGKQIQIEFEVKDGECIIGLTDCGDSFDPSLVPEPDMKEYLDQRKVGGLGLFLIRTLMDSMEYASLPDGCNRLIMKKRFNGAEQKNAG
jgi:serine/threonine-protein kinase RsbW